MVSGGDCDTGSNLEREAAENANESDGEMIQSQQYTKRQDPRETLPSGEKCMAVSNDTGGPHPGLDPIVLFFSAPNSKPIKFHHVMDI